MDDSKVLELSSKLCELAVEHFNSISGPLKDYDCPICKNKGMVAVLENGQDLYKTCSCMEIRKTLELQETSGLKEMLNKYKLDSFKTEEPWQELAVKKAKSYIETQEGWFFMGGKTGVGKTHLCTAIVGELLNKGMPCKYMAWREEARELKAKVNTAEYKDLIDPLKRTKVLYIDDFLKGGITQGDINLAFEILNHRYVAGLPTLISTELRIQEILKLDEAIGGRICQMAKGNLLEVQSGTNYRLKKGAGA